MKYSAKFIVPLILIFFVTGCSMFRTQQSGTLFTFNYEGKTYEIAGYTNSEGESANYLTYRENDVWYVLINGEREYCKPNIWD